MQQQDHHTLLNASEHDTIERRSSSTHPYVKEVNSWLSKSLTQLLSLKIVKGVLQSIQGSVGLSSTWEFFTSSKGTVTISTIFNQKSLLTTTYSNSGGWPKIIPVIVDLHWIKMALEAKDCAVMTDHFDGIDKLVKEAPHTDGAPNFRRVSKIEIAISLWQTVLLNWRHIFAVLIQQKNTSSI